MAYGILALLGAVALVLVFGRETRRELSGFLTGLALVSITWSGVDPTASPLSDALLGLALVAAAPGLLAGRSTMRLPVWVLLAGLCVALATVLNGLAQTPQAYMDGRHLTYGTEAYPEGARQVLNAMNGLKLLIALIVIPLLIGAVARTRSRLESLADLWALSAVVACLVAVTDFVGVTQVNTGLGQGFGIAGGRVAGLSNHPVHLSTVAVMALPVVMTWLVASGRRRWLGIGSVLVLLGGVFVSGSRAGLVAAAFVLVAGSLLLRPVRRFVTLTAAPAALALTAFALIKADAFVDLLQKTRLIGNGGADSDTERAKVVAQAVRDIHERWLLGVGFDIAGDGHSVYLQTVAAGGVLTLLALVVYTVSTLRTVRLRTSSAPGGAPDLLVLACLVSVAVWLMVAVFENALVERYMYLPLAFLLAVAKLREDEQERAPRRWARPGVPVSAG